MIYQLTNKRLWNFFYWGCCRTFARKCNASLPANNTYFTRKWPIFCSNGDCSPQLQPHTPMFTTALLRIMFNMKYVGLYIPFSSPLGGGWLRAKANLHRVGSIGCMEHTCGKHVLIHSLSVPYDIFKHSLTRAIGSLICECNNDQETFDNSLKFFKSSFEWKIGSRLSSRFVMDCNGPV